MHWPAIQTLIPHAGSMLLLDGVVDHAEAHTECRFVPRPDSPFGDANGDTPPWIAIEYMAQCAAAHGGLARVSSTSPPPVGFLVGTRRFRFSAEPLRCGEPHRVRATGAGSSGGLHVFDCVIRREGSAADLATARIQVYVTSPEALPRD
ncbi:MAG: hypothetical protein HKP27_12110 [Myxococcales bacterium]|nr:hypothetical protein [Myxococcales bacterium]